VLQLLLTLAFWTTLPWAINTLVRIACSLPPTQCRLSNRQPPTSNPALVFLDEVVLQLRDLRLWLTAVCTVCVRRLSNRQPPVSNPAPVFLDEVVLQYWFQGPEEPTAASAAALAAGEAASGSSSSNSSDLAQEEAVAALVASQFKMSCSDATAAIGESVKLTWALFVHAAQQHCLLCNPAALGISAVFWMPMPTLYLLGCLCHVFLLLLCGAGCEGIAWNVTAGLFDVFGARFVLNIWFPRQDSNRYLLLPNGTTADSTAAAATVAALQKQQQNAPNGSNIEILPLEQIEGILLLSYRRFFSSINARDDYSFLETPLAPTTRNDSSGKPIVRRQRGANVQLPAYWGGRLAWGSPPIAKKVKSCVVRLAVHVGVYACCAC
jgi:hypothetical protein